MLKSRSTEGKNIREFSLEKNCVRRGKSVGTDGGRPLIAVTDENCSKMYRRSTILSEHREEEKTRKFVVALYDGREMLAAKAKSHFQATFSSQGRGPCNFLSEILLLTIR